METEAKIGLRVKNGNVLMRVQIGKLTQAEVAMLIVHLELVSNDLKSKFAKRLKKIEE